MDDLRNTMGPVEKCLGGTCIDKHNVHVVLADYGSLLVKLCSAGSVAGSRSVAPGL